MMIAGEWPIGDAMADKYTNRQGLIGYRMQSTCFLDQQTRYEFINWDSSKLEKEVSGCLLVGAGTEYNSRDSKCATEMRIRAYKRKAGLAWIFLVTDTKYDDQPVPFWQIQPWGGSGKGKCWRKLNQTTEFLYCCICSYLYIYIYIVIYGYR